MRGFEGEFQYIDLKHLSNSEVNIRKLKINLKMNNK